MNSRYIVFGDTNRFIKNLSLALDRALGEVVRGASFDRIAGRIENGENGGRRHRNGGTLSAAQKEHLTKRHRCGKCGGLFRGLGFIRHEKVCAAKRVKRVQRRKVPTAPTPAPTAAM